MKQINSAAGIARKGLILTTFEAQAGLQSPDAAYQRQEGAGRRSGKLERLMTCSR